VRAYLPETAAPGLRAVVLGAAQHPVGCSRLVADAGIELRDRQVGVEVAPKAAVAVRRRGEDPAVRGNIQGARRVKTEGVRVAVDPLPQREPLFAPGVAVTG